MPKIKLSLGHTSHTATLIEHAASRDLLSLLPLTLTFKDYAETEKIAYLPRKLTTLGTPAGKNPAVGHLAYYAPWGNLAVFYKPFAYSNGLIPLGVLDSGIEAFAACSGDFTITIEPADEKAI